MIKKKQGGEYHLVDKTATPLSTGYIRFIASGSELRHVCVCVCVGGVEDD